MFIVQVLPDPPVIVPMLVFVASRTVMPMTSAGDPTVVSVVPERDAVNDRALAADQLVVVVVSQVPVPPTQYRFATAYASGAGAGFSISAIQLASRRCFSASMSTSDKGWSSGYQIASENSPYLVAKLKLTLAIKYLLSSSPPERPKRCPASYKGSRYTWASML